MNIKEELNAFKEWKLGGRGKTMSECFDWKNSHSQMFIEGYRVAKEKYCNEWHTENPTKDGVYLCTVEECGSITYKVCKWLNEPYLKYDRNWQDCGYTVIKWKEIE